jgi:uncharacterized protein (TIGR02246 family)
MALSLEDTTAILQLYSRYNTAIDTGDGKGFGNCFTAEGIFEPGNGRVEGQEAIAEFGNQTHESMPLMRHNATNIVVEGDGSTATGSAFLIGYLAGSEYKVIVTGRYSDSLTKTDGGWRFTERLFAMDK